MERGEPEEIVYMTESGYAEFSSSVPLHTFTGKSRHLVGMIDFNENVIDFYLDLSTIKTGIGRRDRDMYRTLNIDEFPFAEFTGKLELQVDPETNSRQHVTADGEFTVHGVTRDVRINGYIEKQENGGLLLEAEWTLLLENYEIEPPGILFYRVSDEQKIRIEVLLEPRKREEVINGN
ncbi:MAG: YceI family protein [Balneolales bacterium]